jgi:hypothetical protein
VALQDRQGERRLRAEARRPGQPSPGRPRPGGVDATTVIDIPWAIDALADSVGRIVTAGIDQLIDIGRRFVDALGRVRDIATQVGDHTKLPGGKWPEAVDG